MYFRKPIIIRDREVSDWKEGHCPERRRRRFVSVGGLTCFPGKFYKFELIESLEMHLKLIIVKNGCQFI